MKYIRLSSEKDDWVQINQSDIGGIFYLNEHQLIATINCEAFLINRLSPTSITKLPDVSAQYLRNEP